MVASELILMLTIINTKSVCSLSQSSRGEITLRHLKGVSLMS